MGRVRWLVAVPLSASLSQAADAIKRTACAGGQIAVNAVVVDAKDGNGRRFYQAFGFIALRGRPMRPFLPLGSIAL